MALDSMEVTVIDHSDLALQRVQELARAALEMIGTQAEAYAKLAITDSKYEGIELTRYGEKDNSRVDFGAMRNSVTHVVQSDAVYIGSNLEYAIWNELGTGIYASQPGGRMTPWRYQDRRGKWHVTRGMYPLHFLKNAAANHMEEYTKIFNDIMKNG